MKFVMSRMDWMSTSRRSDVKAGIATGASWRPCSRFSAATTCSARVFAADWAWADAPIRAASEGLAASN
ncbi:MAG: hypothetical protein ABS78_13350 [Phenylobacterium sp. SCN 70-31]|nr:MAG: hypothetical protein ABS78_13350 [Phenylobacterium sp. SCN 70-31]